MFNRITIIALLSLTALFATTDAPAQKYPRDPAARARYIDARAQSAHYAAEAARYDTQHRALRRTDRWAKPLRRASDYGVRTLSRRTGMPGRAIGGAYRYARNRMGGYGQ